MSKFKNLLFYIKQNASTEELAPLKGLNTNPSATDTVWSYDLTQDVATSWLNFGSFSGGSRFESLFSDLSSVPEGLL